MVTYVPDGYEGCEYTTAEQAALNTMQHKLTTAAIGMAVVKVDPDESRMLARALKKAMVYEQVLRGMLKTGAKGRMSDREKMRAMYLDAISALGYCECILPGDTKPVVMRRNAVKTLNEGKGRKGGK